MLGNAQPGPLTTWYLILIAAQVAALVWHVVWCLIPTLWPTVEGTITGTRVDQEGAHYAPRVLFSYTVDGHTYTGERFWWVATHYEDDQAAAAALSSFRPGMPIVVRHHPHRHDEAVCVLSITSAWVVLFAIITVAITASVLRSGGETNGGAPWVGVTVWNALCLAWLVHVTRRGAITVGED